MPTKNILSEQNLIIAIANRQRLGAAALYDMYAQNLYIAIYRIVKHKEIAEDVLQLVLMKIWDSFHLYSIEKGRLYTWMVTIARNQAITTVRSKDYLRQVNNSELDTVITDVDTQHFTIQDIDVLGVKELLNLLKADQRHILTLIYFQGYTHVEVAEHLAIPLGTVKTRWTNAIRTLRQLLNIKSAA